jgi:hypothetical protein
MKRLSISWPAAAVTLIHVHDKLIIAKSMLGGTLMMQLCKTTITSNTQQGACMKFRMKCEKLQILLCILLSDITRAHDALLLNIIARIDVLQGRGAYCWAGLLYTTKQEVLPVLLNT